MNKAIKVLLVGLGNMGHKYSTDPIMKESVQYSTHSQVINAHPLFSFQAAVDQSDKAINLCKSKYIIQETSNSIESLKYPELVDVAILATPPINRLKLIKKLPNLKGVIIEKPIGLNTDTSREFVDYCSNKGLITQVNYTRRTDELMKKLSTGELKEKVGKIQCGFGVYGNGILNYAAHTIDLIRMIVGEITAVKALKQTRIIKQGPIKSDINIPFILYVNDIQITLYPINFSLYREGSLDLWGEKGRIEILQEGLVVRTNRIENCRSSKDSKEINFDHTNRVPTGYSKALYNLYDDFAYSLNQGQEITASNACSALINEEIVDAINLSQHKNGSVIEITQ